MTEQYVGDDRKARKREEDKFEQETKRETITHRRRRDKELEEINSKRE